MRRASKVLAALAGSAFAVGSAHCTALAGEGDVERWSSSNAVINEVVTRSANGELDEYLELRNIGTTPLDLSGFQLRSYGADCAVRSTLVVPEGLVLSPMNSAGQFLVFAGLNFSGTVAMETTVLPYPSADPAGFLRSEPGAASLHDPRGTKVDAVAWAAPATRSCGQEGDPARTPPPLSAESIGRDLLSTDSDDNRRDFGLTRKSPGACL